MANYGWSRDPGKQSIGIVIGSIGDAIIGATQIFTNAGYLRTQIGTRFPDLLLGSLGLSGGLRGSRVVLQGD